MTWGRRPVAWCRRIWHRKWVHQLVAYLAVTAAFGYLLVQVDQTNDVQCQDRADGRTALRAVIMESFRSSGGVDFTQVESFDELDEATQVYFINLGEMLAAAGNREEVRDRILATVPPIECR